MNPRDLPEYQTSDSDIAARDRLVAEAEGLLTRAGGQPLEGEARSRFDELTSQLEEWDRRDRQIADMHEGVRSGAFGLEAGAAFGRPEILRRTGDPWAEDARARFGDDHQRGRAFAALERSTAPDVAKATVEALIADEQTGTLAARWAVATTSPEYRQAFREYLTRPETAALDFTAAQNSAVSEAAQVRAALSIGSGDAGGYLMPFELDPTVAITNAGVTNPIRVAARTVQTTTNVWHGVSSAGVSAEWLAEAAEANDNSPTFAQPSVTCHRASAYVQASLEAAADTSIPEQLTLSLASCNGPGFRQVHGTTGGWC